MKCCLIHVADWASSHHIPALLHHFKVDIFHAISEDTKHGRYGKRVRRKNSHDCLVLTETFEELLGDALVSILLAHAKLRGPEYRSAYVNPPSTKDVPYKLAPH